MKRRHVSGIIVLAVGVLAPQFVPAQGTVTYLSNLGYTSTGSQPVGSDSWLGANVYTGDNAGGYVLNSVQLALTDASGDPSGFSVMLYSAPPGAAVLPGTSLATLSGSLDPVTAGTYTYTAPPDLTLSPSTDYFIVLTAGTTVANGAYEWSATSTYPPILSGDWAGDNSIAHSSDGLNWNFVNGPYFAQFAIEASPVPEPGGLGLMTVGGLFLIAYRQKDKLFR